MGTSRARLAVSLAMAVVTASAAAGCEFSSATAQVVYITDTFAPVPFTPMPLASSSPTLPEFTSTATLTDSLSPTPDSPSPTPAGPTASPTGVPTLVGVSSTTTTDGGTTAQCGAWKVSFKKPVVSGVSGAEVINSAVAAKVKEYVDQFKAQILLGGGNGPCTLDGHFTVALRSQSILSLSFTMAEYLGGASSASLAGSLTFGVADGAQIALADLFESESAGAAVLSTQSRDRLQALFGSTADVGWISSGTTPYVSNFATSWVMGAGGLQITFPQLQVASAVAGTPTIVIPWSSLKSSLNPNGPAGAYSH